MSNFGFVVFMLIFEAENEADSVAFNVAGEDVVKMLNECRRPAERMKTYV